MEVTLTMSDFSNLCTYLEDHPWLFKIKLGNAERA